MTPGYVTMKGWKDTEEGVNKKIVHYYARKLISDLLPARVRYGRYWAEGYILHYECRKIDYDNDLIMDGERITIGCACDIKRRSIAMSMKHQDMDVFGNKTPKGTARHKVG
jgi:hypothetical protein